MKQMPLLILGGWLSTFVWAGPSAELQTLDGQSRVVITHLPLPPQNFNLDTLNTKPKKTASIGPAFVINETIPPKAELSSNARWQAIPGVLNAPTFVIEQGMSPLSALRQWLQSESLKRVAWSLSEDAKAILNTPFAEQQMFAGSLKDAVSALGEKLDLPLQLSTNPANGLVAIHTLGPRVTIHWVEGETLQSAIKQLVKEYNWQWADTPAFSSWMAKDDYPFLAPYAIVTPIGAIDLALNYALDGYPIQADLISSTQLVLIREKY